MGTGEAILMARFLDRDGLPLNPNNVCSISYSIYRFDPIRRDVRKLAAGYDRVALNVAKIICDSFRTNEVWTVDNIGYNFFHRIRFSDCENAFPSPEGHYEVRYWVTQTTGEMTVVCFRIGVV